MQAITGRDLDRETMIISRPIMVRDLTGVTEGQAPHAIYSPDGFAKQKLEYTSHLAI